MSLPCDIIYVPFKNVKYIKLIVAANTAMTEPIIQQSIKQLTKPWIPKSTKIISLFIMLLTLSKFWQKSNPTRSCRQGAGRQNIFFEKRRVDIKGVLSNCAMASLNELPSLCPVPGTCGGGIHRTLRAVRIAQISQCTGITLITGYAKKICC